VKRDMKTVFVCQACGQTSGKWLGRCTGCGAWHSMVEERLVASPKEAGRSGRGKAGSPVLLAEVRQEGDGGRVPTEIPEMDRVLGGGLMQGGVVLLAGEPGIGKSTLLLQVLCRLGRAGQRVLYVSGEESAAQIRMRAERIGEIPPGLWVLGEVDLDAIEEAVKELDPSVLAVDSVQTLSSPALASAPGSVGQVREAAAHLIRMAKPRGMPAIIVGHVTKEGAIAGPRVLEHLVDTVLSFEGDRSHSFRILRTAKNRFGPTHEIGVFEMTGEGLREVPNPSEVFLGQRPTAVPGSVAVPSLEGTRPILVELQALVSPSHTAMPRRTSTGVEGNRLALLIAVAERHLGVTLYDRDIFINVVGGLRITETAVDLGVVTAMVSSLRQIPLDPGTAVFGEVGLTGEVRGVNRSEVRLRESARLGLTRCVLPKAGLDRLNIPAGLAVVPVRRLEEAVEELVKVP